MDGSKAMHIQLNSGSGLLDARALWACLVGPQRLAMAQSAVVTLLRDRAVEVANNLGAAECYVFIGVGLPQNAAVNPLQVVFSREESTGRNTGLPSRLIDQVNGFSFSFTQLLLPGEQIFGQITDAAVERQNIVVVKAVF